MFTFAVQAKRGTWGRVVSDCLNCNEVIWIREIVGIPLDQVELCLYKHAFIVSTLYLILHSWLCAFLLASLPVNEVNFLSTLVG